jgi:hypothetical protein
MKLKARLGRLLGSAAHGCTSHRAVRSSSSARLRLPSLAAGAICALLVAAPAPAVAKGKREKYAGPIDLPELEPGVVPHATIEFTLRSKAKRGSKRFVPRLVDPLKERNMYLTCNPPFPSKSTPGDHVYPTTGNSDNNFVMVFEGNIRVKKRSFSSSYTDNYSDGSSESFAVTGTVSRHGPATGTIRLVDHFPAENDHPAIDCDSGPLNWTATKR